jgi:uncharacterized lipoprotein YajG
MKIKLLGVLSAVFMLASCSAENTVSEITDIPGTITSYISQLTE